ncbi:MAG: hypothetical protein DME25_21400, partial [Verrucomicrobia bacterium]
DTSVVFNEIMYHPATNEPAMEWVELRNQMSVDVDLSGWSITGGIQYSFASNTIVRGGGYVLVALSPPTLMATVGSTNVLGPFTVNYGVDGDWPVAPDGSGVSLAKRDRDSASGPAENWTWSEQVGGTPGADNFLPDTPPETRLVPVDSTWRYDASGTDLGTAWRGPGYPDDAWASRAALTNRPVPGLFNTGLGANGNALSSGALDPHYLLTAAAQGVVGTNAIVMLNNAAWLANDATSVWIGVNNNGANNVNAGAYNYQTSFSLSGFLPATVRINLTTAVDNDLTNVFFNGLPTGLATSGFSAFNPPLTINSGFVAGTNTLEFRTVNAGTTPNPHGFRAVLSGTGLAINTNAPLPLGPTTYYFRKSFTFSGDPAFTRLQLNPVVADGAAFYLNGVEVYRQNLPPAASYGTFAVSNVVSPTYSGPIEISAASLRAGLNVLAVEVHPAVDSTDDILLGAELISTPLPAPSVALAFNELSSSTNGEFWLELANYGTNTIQLDGDVIVRDGLTDNEYLFPAGRSIAPGGYLAITNT